MGPYGEADAVRRALQHMHEHNPKQFGDAKTKRLPDVLIPGQWAIEAKIIRPFGDNGIPAEHWSENILHPYPGNTSSLGDCLKLLNSSLSERKGILVFGYEHSPAQIPLDPAILSFELLASEIINVSLSPRVERRVKNLCHPIHQVLRVFMGTPAARNRVRTSRVYGSASRCRQSGGRPKSNTEKLKFRNAQSEAHAVVRHGESVLGRIGGGRSEVGESKRGNYLTPKLVHDSERASRGKTDARLFAG